MEKYNVLKYFIEFLNLIHFSGASLPRPIATPVDQTVKSGERASFHCDANSETPARIKWGYKTADGPFRGDIYQSGDDVIINLADASNAGEYICTATNQYGSAEAEPVRLHVTDSKQIFLY